MASYFRNALLLSSFLLLFLFILGCGNDASPSGGTTTAAEAEEVPEDAPVIIEKLEEVPAEEPVAEESTEVLEDEAAAEEVLEEGPKTVEILNEKFAVNQITVSIGDTLVWKNVRTGSSALTGAMIIGVRNCADVKSTVFKPGNTFSWTFNEPETCTIVDGIRTTMNPMKVIVE
ncbi:hypothetical protein HYS49_02350 [Candidatus Woesearchaeota archaeon]|nr:hypothetical protein [Candidatus Woesearchaeota archaeon]